MIIILVIMLIREKNSQWGASRKRLLWLFTKNLLFTVFWIYFLFLIYVYMWISPMSGLWNTTVCPTAKTLPQKGSAPSESGMTLTITNFMTFVLCSYHHENKVSTKMDP